ncbi:unnamed protein product [Trichobilharzia szidati]|nr:unnamed protein product [Trichobilharzia szidati]
MSFLCFNKLLCISFLLGLMLTMNHCCQEIGAPCTGTFIRRCCGDLQCEYDTLGFGTCQKCIHSNFHCRRNSQCCSNYCKFSVCL